MQKCAMLIIAAPGAPLHLRILPLRSQPTLQVSQTLLLCQELLPLLLNLPLHLELNLAQLLLLATKLVLLELDGLVGELLAGDGSVGVVAVDGAGELCARALGRVGW